MKCPWLFDYFQLNVWPLCSGPWNAGVYWQKKQKHDSHVICVMVMKPNSKRYVPGENHSPQIMFHRLDMLIGMKNKLYKLCSSENRDSRVTPLLNVTPLSFFYF